MRNSIIAIADLAASGRFAQATGAKRRKYARRASVGLVATCEARKAGRPLPDIRK